MQTVTLKVTGMSCMGCVASVKRVTGPIPGVSSVDVALDKGEVTVSFDGGEATLAAVRAAIQSAGYDLAG